MKKYAIILLFLLGACSHPKRQELIGIWELKGLKIDQYQYDFQPTFIQFNKNSSFAIAQTSGDLVGIYSLGSNKINFKSDDNLWFDNTWILFINDDFLSLKGKDQRSRNSDLQFKRVANVPDYQEFEDLMIGQWELYKIRQDNNYQIVSNTWMSISDGSTYHISKDQEVIEHGEMSIDTRHQKIIFESDQSIWKAWFYGRELRLSNKRTGLQYSLRKGGTAHTKYSKTKLR